MAVGPADNIRTIVRTVGVGETLYANTFYSKIVGGPSISDAVALQDQEDWMTSILTPLFSSIDTQVGLGVCQVDLVEVTGVYNPDPELNTAKVVVVRPLGFIAPAWNPVNNGEEIDGISTMSIVAKCFIPGPRPRKSVSGFVESVVLQKIFINAALAAATSYAINWLAGPSFSYFAGVMSLKAGIFQALDGSFSIKNSGGTMTTRKIGRGS
jgi:hypothetical protein